MASLSSPSSILILTITLWFSQPSMAAIKSPNNYIWKACLTTEYPSQCYISLIPSATKISGNPKLLALNAIAVAYSKTKEAMKSILEKKKGRSRKYSPLADCMSQMSNGAARLQNSEAELKKVGGFSSSRKRLRWEWSMSNVQTWVSAAMTDAVSCADGLKGETRTALKPYTDAVVVSTSVALKFTADISSSSH